MSLLCSCFNFGDSGLNTDGYREDSGSGILINDGSLVGSWEQTYKWDNRGGEFTALWKVVDIKTSDNFIFLEDGRFTSTKNITDCLESSGTYTIEGTSLKLIYNCEPLLTKEVIIDEFFFREKYIVFIQGEGTSNISKFELVK